MSKRNKKTNNNSMRAIWERNKTELEAEAASDGVGDRKARIRASFAGKALWLVKVFIMSVVSYAVAISMATLVVPRFMGEFYSAIFSGVDEVSNVMLVGSWIAPAGFFVCVLLFLTCAVLVLFWKWLGRLTDDIMRRRASRAQAGAEVKSKSDAD